MPLGQPTIIKGRNLFNEATHGAYYYAFSGAGTYSSTKYTEAFANIVLPTQIKNQGIGSKRNGFVSLGVGGATGAGDGVDCGIKNDGTGWYPCYLDVSHKYDEFPAFKAPSSATNAKIVVTPVNPTTINVLVQFLNSSGANVGTTFYQPIVVTSHTWSRFYRFASLVPEGTDNQQDSTYMKGGKFINLGLFNKVTGKYDPWGIGTSLISDAWTWSNPRAQVTYTNNGDTFDIDHWA